LGKQCIAVISAAVYEKCIFTETIQISRDMTCIFLLNLSGDFNVDSTGLAIECHCIIKKS